MNHLKKFKKNLRVTWRPWLSWHGTTQLGVKLIYVNPISTTPTKWSNTLKQLFECIWPFVGLVLTGLIIYEILPIPYTVFKISLESLMKIEFLTLFQLFCSEILAVTILVATMSQLHCFLRGSKTFSTLEKSPRRKWIKGFIMPRNFRIYIYFFFI